MEKHKFSFNTVKEFDNHISASITGYEILHQLIVNISGFFIKDFDPIDLGCTSGKLTKCLNDTYNCDGIGYDVTEKNFLSGLRLFKQDISEKDFTIPKTNLVTCIFTLQFIDYNSRLEILKKVYESLVKNGGFIVCEKEIAKSGIIQEVFTFSNYEYKRKKFTADEILDKEKDLRQIMNPLQSDENIELFKRAGFKIIEPFFQSLNFRGYLCKK